MIQIKHKYTGNVLFEAEVEIKKACLELAVSRNTNLVYADLSDANLVGADLVGANLSSADLSSADLVGANLSSADLSGANLVGANLSSADLSGADLSDANLSSADLVGADLSSADLSGANLVYADLSGADLSGADFRDAKFSNFRGITAQITPLQLLGFDNWNVLIFDNHMKIGCQIHSFNEWKNFTDEQINEMDTDALEWWSENKQVLFSLMDLQASKVKALEDER